MRTIERTIDQVKEQVEALQSEQQGIVADLQEEKKIVKEKQVHLSHILVFIFSNKFTQ